MWVATLARLTEQLDQGNVAERLYRRYAALATISDGRRTLAAFLGRHGRVNDALDALAPLWSQTRDVEALAGTCFQLIVAAEKTVDDAQFERVAAWLNEAIKRNNNSARLVLILGNLRTEQKHLEDVQKLYRQVVDQVSQSDLSQSDRNVLLANGTIILRGSQPFTMVRQKMGLLRSTGRFRWLVTRPTCSTRGASSTCAWARPKTRSTTLKARLATALRRRGYSIFLRHISKPIKRTSPRGSCEKPRPRGLTAIAGPCTGLSARPIKSC